MKTYPIFVFSEGYSQFYNWLEKNGIVELKEARYILYPKELQGSYGYKYTTLPFWINNPFYKDLNMINEILITHGARYVGSEEFVHTINAIRNNLK